MSAIPGAQVTTPMLTGATDRPTYRALGIVTYGFDPFKTEKADAQRGVHGNDERVGVADARIRSALPLRRAALRAVGVIMPDTKQTTPSLDAHWMPFTANRAFKKAPRLLVAAKGMFYTSADGRQVLDGTAGLWCVNAGHGREPIVRAIAESTARLDYAPGFQMGHPGSFALAERLATILPGRPGSRLLHQLRLRGRGYGAQDRPRLLPGAR